MRIFGFKNRYPQSFLDKLAKDLGFKWTKVKMETTPFKDVKVHPLPPPSGELYYMEMNHRKSEDNGNR